MVVRSPSSTSLPDRSASLRTWPNVAPTITDRGLQLLEVDLATVAPAELAATLEAAEAVFVTGGYPLYLLEWAQRSGFLNDVRERFAAGELAYVGISAGSALAGPTCRPSPPRTIQAG